MDGLDDQVYCLAEYNGELYVGGRFSMAGGNAAMRIAKWNDIEWSTFGANVYGNVDDLIVYQGELYAAGDFYHIGTETVGGIGRWNGVSWSAVGNQPFSGGATCFAIYNDELYVGGFWGLLKWDGSDWSSVGSGFNGLVNALTVHNGELYAVGDFFSPYVGIAKYDGTIWSAVGNSGSGGGVEGFPKAVASYNGNLYVGGLLFYVDGMAVEGIAKWDGVSWSSVGGGLNNDVEAFLVADGKLYAAGFFTRAGENEEVVLPHVGAWDDSSWLRIQPVSGLNSWAFALAMYNGCLYAGGNFNGYGFGTSLFHQIAKYCAWVGITEDPLDGSCTVYPNPSDGHFQIRMS